MLPFDSVISLCILSTLFNIIPLSLSQTTSPTTSTTAKPEEEEAGFFSATTTEIIILVAVIIGCPICILLLCKWQKNKTAKFKRSRQSHLDRITAGAMQRQQIQMAQAQQRAGGGGMMSTNGVPVHAQSPSQQPMIQHGEMNERHSQNPAQAINTSNAKPLQLITDAPSDDKDQPPPPAGPPPANSRAKSMAIKKRTSIAKQPKDFDRRKTEMVHGSKRAIQAQDKGKDAQRQKSNSILQRKANGQFSSKGVPAPPSGPPPASPKEAKPDGKRDVALDMLIESPKHQPPPAWTTPIIQNKDKDKKQDKKKPGFMKIQSISDVHAKLDMESALVLPDVEDDVNNDPPEAIPRTKTFDAKTGAPIELELDAVVNGDSDKNRERIKTEDIERSLSIQDDDNKDKSDDAKGNENGNISDSSSGEPLDDKDKNLLQIAHQQMESQPPPSLQTIFGRKVTNKDDNNSDSEDSLLKRQQDFEQGKENEEIAPSKPESTFVLNV